MFKTFLSEEQVYIGLQNQMTPHYTKRNAVRGKVGAENRDQLCCVLELCRIREVGIVKGVPPLPKFVCNETFQRNISGHFPHCSGFAELSNHALPKFVCNETFHCSISGRFPHSGGFAELSNHALPKFVCN